MFSSCGHPVNVFAPSATRLARAFHAYPDRDWFHQELVESTELSKGYVSKVLARLEKAGFIEKHDGQRYRIINPDNMLSAWRESYDFNSHRILKGHIAERVPDEVLRCLVDSLGGTDTTAKIAITGLAAAWHYTRHTAFRLCALYVDPIPDDDQLDQIGFRQVESGANTWLVQPNDKGVFAHGISRGGLPFVSALQAYLDLKDHPERAQEAADVLRSKLQIGLRHG